MAQIYDAIGLIGAPKYCAQQPRSAEASRVMYLYPMTGESCQLPQRELQAFQDAIFPALA